MKNEENRRVQGSYINQNELKKALENLYEKGYVNEEICLVVKQGHDLFSELKDSTIESFEVTIDHPSQSFFGKLMNLVLVEEEKSAEELHLLDLGLEEVTVERFTPALEEGFILLLVDSVAPRGPRHYYK